MPPLPASPKRSVLGVGISTTSYRAVTDSCREWVAQHRAAPNRPARYICVTSVHGVMTAQENVAFRRAINDADIATPDGMPLVWALRSFGERGQERVYGPTLMLRLCSQAETEGHRMFLYGGRPETLPLLRSRLLQRFPRLIVAGEFSPPFRALRADEEDQMRQHVLRSRPDLIFVGISTPKQELWMAEHRECFSGTVMIGVGAAFDFHAGRVKQAPPWMQNAGLEWLFRLLSEPTRLWKRYLLVTPRFLPRWAMQKTGLRKYPLMVDSSSVRLTLDVLAVTRGKVGA